MVVEEAYDMQIPSLAIVSQTLNDVDDVHAICNNHQEEIRENSLLIMFSICDF
ncbi:hypothetical protein Fmac_029715 [Flemingia macrophylla]|uniref:Uncharacterized protein n=1 Tax=Flemingia macrophylla TaxID=520843 RepID=A0ABD1LBB1_9FABA